MPERVGTRSVYYNWLGIFAASDMIMHWTQEEPGEFDQHPCSWLQTQNGPSHLIYTGSSDVRWECWISYNQGWGSPDEVLESRGTYLRQKVWRRSLHLRKGNKCFYLCCVCGKYTFIVACRVHVHTCVKAREKRWVSSHSLTTLRFEAGIWLDLGIMNRNSARMLQTLSFQNPPVSSFSWPTPWVGYRCVLRWASLWVLLTQLLLSWLWDRSFPDPTPALLAMG